MTPEQYWLLRTLNRRGPISIGELADVLGITASSATTACKRLEKLGLLQRERQTADERVVLVALTPAGLAQVEAWHRRRRELVTQLARVLDPSEQDQLARLLARLLDVANGQEGDAAANASVSGWEGEGHERHH
jgi:DNA-binding MarR family transcriptional regulator